jgi:hypothetical protein
MRALGLLPPSAPQGVNGVGSRRRSAIQAIDLPSDGGTNLGCLFRRIRQRDGL